MTPAVASGHRPGQPGNETLYERAGWDALRWQGCRRA